MKRNIFFVLFFLLFVIGVLFSLLFVAGNINTHTETILKHRILRQGGKERHNYIEKKYKYENLQPLYQLSLSYNGWQIYDSTVYEYKNGEVYKYWYFANYANSDTIDYINKYNRHEISISPEFSLREIDTITNDFTDNKLVHEIVCDKYNLLRYYIKDAVHALECVEYASDSSSFPIITDSSYTISSLSCSHSLFFMEYGNVGTSVLNKFSYQINKLNQYECDEFVFNNNIMVRRRFYYKHSGDINSVECLLYVDDTIYNEWMEWFEYLDN